MKWMFILSAIGLVVGVFVTNAVAHATGKVNTFIAIGCMIVAGSLGNYFDMKAKQKKK